MATKKKDKPRHLGRGLESLLGPITSRVSLNSQSVPLAPIGDKFLPDKELQASMRQIQLSRILVNPYQPRLTWDDKELADFAESIKINGVIQPIIVRPAGSEFELIAGERRFRAAKLADLKVIPALVRQATDEEMLELALAENIHRKNLNPIERAKAYHNFLNTFSLTQAEAAERLGEDRSVIANHLRLLDLPRQIQQMLIDGQLSMGHARSILGLPTDELRNKLANRALAGRLSVREVERLVRRYTTASEPDNKQIRTKPAHIVDMENRLTAELGTKVCIETRRDGRRGKIIIEFYSLDEFDRMTERLGLSSIEQA